MSLRLNRFKGKNVLSNPFSLYSMRPLGVRQGRPPEVRGCEIEGHRERNTVIALAFADFVLTVATLSGKWRVEDEDHNFRKGRPISKTS